MIESRNKINIENNNSSMSDLVFLLLIFFVMTSTLISPNAVKLLLPESGSKTVAKDNGVDVYISDNAQMVNFCVNSDTVLFSVNQDVAVPQEKQDELQRLIASRIESGETEACVKLRSAKTIPVQYVVTVIDAVNNINIERGTKHKVILATSPKN